MELSLGAASSTSVAGAGCVAFVKSVKKGPLAETSPMLNDISGVVSWSKASQRRMW